MDEIVIKVSFDGEAATYRVYEGDSGYMECMELVGGDSPDMENALDDALRTAKEILRERR